MNNSKKKINIMMLIFFMLVIITSKVSATDTKITITKETDKFIEGIIETTTEESEYFSETSLESTDQEIDPSSFYYNQLKNDLSRSVYNALKMDTTGIGITSLNLTNQTYSIDVNSFLNDETYRTNTINTQIKKYIYDVIVAFCNDNPSIYWYYDPNIGFNYNINKEEEKITYKSVTLTSNIEEKDDYINFNQKLNEVVDSINGTSTYEIVKKCHDYICNTVVYTKKEDTKIDQTAYDALINQQGVCDAQARLFQLLCNLKGIKNIKVSGMAR